MAQQNTGVLYKKKLDAKDIRNVDRKCEQEKPPYHTATRRKTAQSVSTMASAERGTLVTLALAANAIGNYIPSMLIFPRNDSKSVSLETAQLVRSEQLMDQAGCKRTIF